MNVFCLFFSHALLLRVTNYSGNGGGSFHFITFSQVREKLLFWSSGKFRATVQNAGI